MAIDANYVLERLSTRHIESGGYYGTDVTELSKELFVTPQGLKKTNLEVEEKEFRDLRYCQVGPIVHLLLEY
jgi:hypothetical protein